MTITTSVPTLLRSTALAALLATIATPGTSQEETQSRPFFRFAGGSLTEFADQLVQDASRRGIMANVVMPEAARLVTVPRVELQDASVQAALQAVAQVVASEWDVSVSSFDSSQAGALPVLALLVRPSKRAAHEQSSEPLNTMVLSLNNLTRTVGDETPELAPTPATVLTAIEAGLGTIEGPEATIRYHEDSRLVFVRGTATQVNLAEMIVNRLESDTHLLRERARASSAPGPSGPSMGPAKDTPGPAGPKRNSAERR